VGVLAPALMVLLRSIQGIAAGGEYTGAMAYTSECAPPRHRGLVSSMATVGVTIGLLCGSGAVALLQWMLPPEAVAEWGWRLPFLGSIVVAAIGLMLRAGMPESGSFRAESEPPPMVWQVLRSNAGRILRVIAVIVGANAAFYAGFVYMPDTLAQAKPELAGRAQTVNSVMLAAQVVIVAAGGWISDRLGRRSASILFTLLAIAAVVPAWRLFQRETLEGPSAAQALLVALVTLCARRPRHLAAMNDEQA
jgi:MHS family proline/betaine transporter-like MFS transporter